MTFPSYGISKGIPVRFCSAGTYIRCALTVGDVSRCQELVIAALSADVPILSKSVFEKRIILEPVYRGSARLRHHMVLFWIARHEQGQSRVAQVQEALPCVRPL
jgi:hypothetical protein